MKNKEIKEINDKNDLLGFMLQIQNKNHECHFDVLIEKIGTERNLDLNTFVLELQNDGFVKQIGLNDIYITPKGQNGYISPLKKKWIKMKPCVSYIITYILGVLTPLLTEYLEKKIF